MANIAGLILELERIRESARTLESQAASITGAGGSTIDGAKRAANSLSSLQNQINNTINQLMC